MLLIKEKMDSYVNYFWREWRWSRWSEWDLERNRRFESAACKASGATKSNHEFKQIGRMLKLTEILSNNYVGVSLCSLRHPCNPKPNYSRVNNFSVIDFDQITKDYRNEGPSFLCFGLRNSLLESIEGKGASG